MKNYIITENQFKYLINNLLNEQDQYQDEKSYLNWIKNRLNSEIFITEIYPELEEAGTYPEFFNKDFTKLSLWDNNLSSIPNSIGKLTQLKTLSLSHNNLSFLPESIGNLSQLKELYLHNNNLTILPDSIGNLTQLKELYLSYNNLSSIPKTIGKLTQLEELSFYNNNLSKQEQEKIKRLLPNTNIAF